MDKALKTHITPKMKMVAHADDLVIAVAATALPLAQERMSLVLDRIIEWVEVRGLQFSSQKTQVMTLKGGLKPGYQLPGNDTITSTSLVKYLGVSIDNKRNYWSHITEIAG